MSETPTITFRCPDHLRTPLLEQAERRGLSTTDAINEAISVWLTREQRIRERKQR